MTNRISVYMDKNIREQKRFKGDRLHLDTLLYAIKKNNISFWNTWREKNENVKVLLTGANLNKAMLSGANFEDVSLIEANLSGAEMSEVNLSGADLKDADLSEASLINARLNKAVLTGTYLYKVNLAGAQCIETNFTDVNLSKASLKGANLDSAILNSSDLSNSDLCNCSLVKATLNNVTITGANIYGWNILTWKTKRLNCDYVYINLKDKERLPKNRNFSIGEFDWYSKKLKLFKEVRKSTTPEGRALNHVFLSYAVEDHNYAENLANALEIEGIKVWLDKKRLQPGIQWQKAVKNAIENGVYFIVCFSKNYHNKLRPSISEELTIAFERLQKKQDDKTWLIPIKLLRCDIPDKKIGAGKSLTDLQWIDFSKGWNEAIKKVVQLIKK